MHRPSDSKVRAAYPFPDRYVDVHGSAMHYVEEGRGRPVLFVHGAPTWSYLWRNVLPHVAEHSRAIAVDLIGMGRSAKPDLRYDFFDHARYLEGFIDALQLEDMVLVAHDWGTRYALHYATRHQANVRGLAYSEAFVVDPRWDDFPEDFRSRFQAWRSEDEGWRRLVVENEFVEKVIPLGVMRRLDDEEMRHYREPFPTPESRRMIWQFPNQHPIDGVPSEVSAAVHAYHDVLRHWDVPKLFFHVTPGAVYSQQVLDWTVGNLPNVDVVDLGPGRHFFPEDHPDAMGRALARWLERIS